MARNRSLAISAVLCDVKCAGKVQSVHEICIGCFGQVRDNGTKGSGDMCKHIMRYGERRRRLCTIMCRCPSDTICCIAWILIHYYFIFSTGCDEPALRNPIAKYSHGEAEHGVEVGARVPLELTLTWTSLHEKWMHEKSEATSHPPTLERRHDDFMESKNFIRQDKFISTNDIQQN